MEKQYHLKTIEDILNAVNIKNVHNFIKDFNDWLIFAVSINEAEKIFKEDVKIERKFPDTMIWIDDGKNNKNINIDIINNK